MPPSILRCQAGTAWPLRGAQEALLQVSAAAAAAGAQEKWADATDAAKFGARLWNPLPAPLLPLISFSI